MIISQLGLAAILAVAVSSVPQDVEALYQSDFPKEEFKARWDKLFDAIGSDGAAFLQGAPLARGYTMPRQTNNFYYLSGIETPHACLFLDGRTRKATLFLPSRNPRLERAEGRVLSADDAPDVIRLTGVDEVVSTDALKGRGLSKWLGDPLPKLHVLFSPAEGHAESRHDLVMANRRIAEDPWDGRPSREENLRKLLKERFPALDLHDLTPVLDALRSVKSPREIALIRRASKLSGLGLMEAMRSTRPGVFEYELDAAARYVFLVNGARLEAYRSIAASGRENIWNFHYYRNSSRLKDGELVLMDYAPDYRYYVSDMGRMWPVNGKYTPVQRELLGFVVRYHQEILARIRPGVTARDIREEARKAMEPILGKTRFSKPAYRAAARKLIERGGGVFSHPVGMAVHDEGGYRQGPLRPGHVFAVDPQMWIPEEKLYIRIEDTVAVTGDGVENFTEFVPSELDDIEKFMKGKGILESHPPVFRP